MYAGDDDDYVDDDVKTTTICINHSIKCILQLQNVAG